MKKVLFIATVVKTHINTFHLPYINCLKTTAIKRWLPQKTIMIKERRIFRTAICMLIFRLREIRSARKIYKHIKC